MGTSIQCNSIQSIYSLIGKCNHLHQHLNRADSPLQRYRSRWRREISTVHYWRTIVQPSFRRASLYVVAPSFCSLYQAMKNNTSTNQSKSKCKRKREDQPYMQSLRLRFHVQLQIMDGPAPISPTQQSRSLRQLSTSCSPPTCWTESQCLRPVQQQHTTVFTTSIAMWK